MNIVLDFSMVFEKPILISIFVVLGVLAVKQGVNVS